LNVSESSKKQFNNSLNNFILATPIKFGTDGWRAIIAADFTVENVARVTEATGIWLKERFENPTVVIGHDCRFAG